MTSPINNNTLPFIHLCQNYSIANGRMSALFLQILSYLDLPSIFNLSLTTREVKIMDLAENQAALNIDAFEEIFRMRGLLWHEFKKIQKSPLFRKAIFPKTSIASWQSDDFPLLKKTFPDTKQLRLFPAESPSFCSCIFLNDPSLFNPMPLEDVSLTYRILTSMELTDAKEISPLDILTSLPNPERLKKLSVLIHYSHKNPQDLIDFLIKKCPNLEEVSLILSSPAPKTNIAPLFDLPKLKTFMCYGDVFLKQLKKPTSLTTLRMYRFINPESLHLLVTNSPNLRRVDLTSNIYSLIFSELPKKIEWLKLSSDLELELTSSRTFPSLTRFFVSGKLTFSIRWFERFVENHPRLRAVSIPDSVIPDDKQRSLYVQNNGMIAFLS